MKRHDLQTVGEKAQGRSSKVSSSTQSEHRASSEEGKDVFKGVGVALWWERGSSSALGDGYSEWGILGRGE